MGKVIQVTDFLIYWLAILLPFSMAIAPAPMNVFMGLLLASFLLNKIAKKQWRLFSTGINLPLLVFFLVTCLSLVNSISLKDSMRGGVLRLLQYIFILFALAEGVRDLKHMRRILFAVSCGLALSSIDAIWQVFSGHDFIRGYGPVINLGLVRATASFKDSNTFGIYLSALAGLPLAMAIFCKNGPRRIFYILLSGLAIVGIALTYSRPTLLALYVILWFFAVIGKKRGLLFVLIVFTLSSWFLLPRAVKDWAKEVNYNPVRFMCNDDRIAIYRNSLNMIRHHPVIGVGANTFMRNYQTYKESPEYMNIVTLDYMYAHNNFLHMAGEIGLAGLAVFIWLIYAYFVSAWKTYKSINDGSLKIFSLALIACLAAFLINGLTESSLYSSRVALIFWYLAGFSLGLKRLVDERSSLKA